MIKTVASINWESQHTTFSITSINAGESMLINQEILERQRQYLLQLHNQNYIIYLEPASRKA